MNIKNLDEQVLHVCPAATPDGKSPVCVVGDPTRPLFSSLDKQEEMMEGEVVDSFHQAEKKRRLTDDQVKFLELSFEMENKLDPERKLLIAKQLGLQPRQVAVWFQNRRARWKIKQLERDFDVLKASHEAIVKENEKLRAEVVSLNTLLNELNGKKHHMQTEDTGSIAQESAASDPATTTVYPNNLKQSVDKAQDVPSKLEVDSPTKSDQSEVLDSGYYIPTSEISLLKMIEDWTPTLYSNGLLESMYNSVLLQQVAAKFEESVFQEDNCNCLVFSLDEHGSFPWYN